MLGPADLVCCAQPMTHIPFMDRLAPLREAGFAGVSVGIGDYLAMRDAGLAPADMRRRIADAGLAVADIELVGLWLPGHDAVQGAWANALSGMTADVAIEAADDLGARGILVTEMLGLDLPREIIAEAFADICDRAADCGARVHLEGVSFGTVADFAAARDIVTAAGRPNAALTLDPWHYFRAGGTLADLAATPGHLIGCVQLCDAPATPSGDALKETATARLMPGEGAFDLTGMIAVLDAIGSAAPLSVEVFHRANRHKSADELAGTWAAAARSVIAKARAETTSIQALSGIACPTATKEP